MMGEWLAIALLGALGWLVWDGLQKREAAIDAARVVCRRAEVQLLDETVSLRRLALHRDEGQQIRVYREFAFEYALTGNERLPGRVYLLGSKVLGCELIEIA